jgi:hypothetical protein
MDMPVMVTAATMLKILKRFMATTPSKNHVRLWSDRVTPPALGFITIYRGEWKNPRRTDHYSSREHRGVTTVAHTLSSY